MAQGYAAAKPGTQVREGQGIRTFRRSFAEITFKDGSAIRVNEQTDLVIQSAAALRRIRLERGALWVKDEKGSRTSVQTPVGTATARGTVFLVDADGTVTVNEGEVELEAAGLSIVLGPGESGGIGPDGSPRKLGGQPSGPGEKERDWYERPQELTPVPNLLSGGILTGLIGTGLSGGGSRDRQEAPVPEPATLGALAVGAGALLLRRRRR